MSSYIDLMIAIIKQAEYDIKKFPDTHGRDVPEFYKSDWFERLVGVTGKNFIERRKRK